MIKIIAHFLFAAIAISGSRIDAKPGPLFLDCELKSDSGGLPIKMNLALDESASRFSFILSSGMSQSGQASFVNNEVAFVYESGPYLMTTKIDRTTDRIERSLLLKTVTVKQTGTCSRQAKQPGQLF